MRRSRLNPDEPVVAPGALIGVPVWDEDAFEAAHIRWHSQQGRQSRDGLAVTSPEGGPGDWLSTLSEVSAQRLIAASQMIRRSHPGSPIPVPGVARTRPTGDADRAALRDEPRICSAAVTAT